MPIEHPGPMPPIADSTSRGMAGGIVRWAVFVGFMSLCLILMLRPEPLSFAVDPVDKLAHLTGFCVLLLLAAWVSHGRRLTVFLRLLALLVLLAVLSEWIQSTSLLPHRQGNLTDLAANVIGLAVGGMLIMLYRFFRSAYSSRH